MSQANSDESLSTYVLEGRRRGLGAVRYVNQISNRGRSSGRRDVYHKDSLVDENIRVRDEDLGQPKEDSGDGTGEKKWSSVRIGLHLLF